jgi:N4-gp56 family major capsid protein
MATYYDRQLLQRALPKLVHTQFGQNKDLPQGEGKTITFSKFSALTATTTALTDEYTQPTGQSLSVSQVTGTIAEYGNAVYWSGLLEKTALGGIPDEVITLLGEQAGESIDEIVRDVLVAGTNVFYAGGRTTRTGIRYSDTITPALVRRAKRFLERRNAPTFPSGDYVAIVHPDAVYDLTGDTDWETFSEYAGSTQIFNGEIGRLYGVRFVRSTKAKIFADSGSSGGTSSGAPSGDVADVYATLFLGQNAYGLTELAGGALSMNVISPIPTDVFKRTSVAGWYLIMCSTIIQQDFMVRLEHGATVFTDD